MENLRTYGKPPFTVAVIHGGPGAIGEMAPVASQLAPEFGVLEPLQTTITIDGQVEELRSVLRENIDQTITLLGFSWGAWLSYIFTARYPGFVNKLILIGSGPYEHHYVNQITKTRMGRLTEEERAEYHTIILLLWDPNAIGKAEKFARLGQLAAKTDRYDSVEIRQPESSLNEGNKFHAVLQEAQEMRKSGALLALADQIQCPVVALHGNYDPHPAEGVREPLSAKLKDFRFIILENCGHKPWIERQAQDKFYEILRQELRNAY